MHDGPHPTGPGRHGRHGHHGHGKSPEMAARHARDRDTFHELLRRHDSIRRTVETIPGGIRAVTETDDPALADVLRAHVREMHRRLGEGFGLRHWDPVFAEVFARRDAIRLEVTETPAGVAIEEVSDDPNVALLIRAHGTVVTSFVEGGGRAAALPSPLPADYGRATA